MQLNRSVIALPAAERAYNIVELTDLRSVQLNRHATIKSAPRAARTRIDYTGNAQRHRALEANVIHAGRFLASGPVAAAGSRPDPVGHALLRPKCIG